jgi:hypothetical protein
MPKRVLLALTLALALAAPAAADAHLPASVKLTSCKTGSRSKDRWATYEARMHAVDGSTRMALRFKLIVQEAGKDRSQAVYNPKLSEWHRSRDGVMRYVYSQTVKNLRPGASYRAKVKFLWYDSGGDVIRHTTRQSDACVQDGPFPNLRIASIDSSPGPAAGTSVYTVVVRNSGRASAAAFGVALFVDGALADTRTVDELGPAESTTITVNGPACRRVRAVVDPEHAVAESNETDNSMSAYC